MMGPRIILYHPSQCWVYQSPRNILLVYHVPQAPSAGSDDTASLSRYICLGLVHQCNQFQMLSPLPINAHLEKKIHMNWWVSVL